MIKSYICLLYGGVHIYVYTIWRCTYICLYYMEVYIYMSILYGGVHIYGGVLSISVLLLPLPLSFIRYVVFCMVFTECVV